MNNVKRELQMTLRITNLISVLVLLIVWISHTSVAQEPGGSAGLKIDPAHWKAKVALELRFSLKDKEWIVPIEFKNVSKARQQIIRSNGALMYRIEANVVAADGARGEVVKTRTFSAFPMNSKYAHAEPGQSVFTECNIKDWLLIDKPGTYKIVVERLLSLTDANNNAVGLPVEKTMPVGDIKIHVTP
jgi:hypothetical protein